jgi:glyoxylase-like metal-dependent hydrolase (beta-lactamase superfamily II)
MARALFALTLATTLGFAQGCTITSHETQKVDVGKPARSRELLALIDKPGPIEVETVTSADWAIDRAGLINLDHARAKEAGLKDGEEPIQIYFHVITHPVRGTFIIDSGVENALRDAPDKAAIRGMLASASHVDRMRIGEPLGKWLETRQVKLTGVLLTHLHIDHVLGLPDVADDVPIYIGPGEAGQRAFINVLVQSATDRTLAGKGPLQELSFAKDADGRFSGVLDLFGDQSLFALHVPGHTPGSLAVLARTTDGPVLMTGDTCHTVWGWQHDVEPGSFTGDHAQNAKSLAALRRLAKEHPQMKVLLGHQHLGQ